MRSWSTQPREPFGRIGSSTSAQRTPSRTVDARDEQVRAVPSEPGDQGDPPHDPGGGLGGGAGDDRRQRRGRSRPSFGVGAAGGRPARRRPGRCPRRARAPTRPAAAVDRSGSSAGHPSRAPRAPQTRDQGLLGHDERRAQARAREPRATLLAAIAAERTAPSTASSRVMRSAVRGPATRMISRGEGIASGPVSDPDGHQPGRHGRRAPLLRGERGHADPGERLRGPRRSSPAGASSCSARRPPERSSRAASASTAARAVAGERAEQRVDDHAPRPTRPRDPRRPAARRAPRRPEPPSAAREVLPRDRVGLDAHPRPRAALPHDGRGDAEPGGHLDDPVAVVQADTLDRPATTMGRPPGQTRPTVTRWARGQGAAVCCSIVVVIDLLAVPDQRVSHQERAANPTAPVTRWTAPPQASRRTRRRAGPGSGHAATTWPCPAATPGAAALRPRGDAPLPGAAAGGQRRRAAHAGTAAVETAPGDRGQAARVDRGRPHGQRASAPAARDHGARAPLAVPAPGRRLDALRPLLGAQPPGDHRVAPVVDRGDGRLADADVRGPSPRTRALSARGRSAPTCHPAGARSRR